MDESELILYTFVCVQLSRLMSKNPDSWHRILFMLVCVVLVIKNFIRMTKSENESNDESEDK